MEHTTLVLKIDALILNGTLSGCHLTLPKYVGQWKPLQGLYAQVGIGKHGTSAPLYKEMMKKFPKTNNMEHGFWFCHDNIKRCMNDNKIEYAMDRPIVQNTWPLNIGINISRERVLALEYAMFRLQERKTFLPRCRLSTIGTLPIPSFHFCVPLNHDVDSTSRFSKIRHHNLRLQKTYHINKWKSDGLMGGYFIVGVIGIPYHFHHH